MALGLGLALASAASPGWCGLLETLDGRLFEGEVTPLAHGAVRVQTVGADGSPRALTVPFEEVRRAVFDPDLRGLASAGVLTPGWASADLGPAAKAGFAGQSGGLFLVRSPALPPAAGGADPGTGGGGGDDDVGARFVYREVTLRGETLARVVEVAGAAGAASGEGAAGVMARATLSPGSPAITLAVTGDGTVTFAVRAKADEAPLVEEVLTGRSLPLWLKIARREEGVAGFTSADGAFWDEAGNAPLDGLGWSWARWLERPRGGAAERAWEKRREQEEDHGFQRAWAGVFSRCGTGGAAASAQVDEAWLSGNGVHAIYFDDPAWSVVGRVTFEPALWLGWGLGAPGPGMGRDRFSARFRGWIESSASGEHRFTFRADDAARIAIGGEPQGRLQGGGRLGGVDLEAGRKVLLAVDYVEGGGSATFRLMWDPPGGRMRGIPHRLLHFEVDAAKEAAEIGRLMGGGRPMARGGVLLRDGSFLAGQVRSADRTRVVLACGGGDREVFTHHVARLHLRPVAVDVLPAVSPGRRVAGEGAPAGGWREEPPALREGGGRVGVLLEGGDFLEGDVPAVGGGAVRLHSVLFGVKDVPLGGSGGAEAVVLAEAVTRPAAFVVRLVDGSVLRAGNLEFGVAGARLGVAGLGELVVPARGLAGWQRGGAGEGGLPVPAATRR